MLTFSRISQYLQPSSVWGVSPPLTLVLHLKETRTRGTRQRAKPSSLWMRSIRNECPWLGLTWRRRTTPSRGSLSSCMRLWRQRETLPAYVGFTSWECFSLVSKSLFIVQYTFIRSTVALFPLERLPILLTPSLPCYFFCSTKQNQSYANHMRSNFKHS